jgi:hypothetical protein
MILNMERFERYERVMKWAFIGLLVVCIGYASFQGWKIVIELACRCDCN